MPLLFSRPFSLVRRNLFCRQDEVSLLEIKSAVVYFPILVFSRKLVSGPYFEWAAQSYKVSD